jgi:hypothetical protein
MICKCANPQCDEPLVYLRSGVLYAVDVRTNPRSERATHFFWMCEPCSIKYKLLFNERGDPSAVPIATRIFPDELASGNIWVQRIFMSRHLSMPLEARDFVAKGLNLIHPDTPATLNVPEPRKEGVRLRLEQRNCA